MRFLRLAFTTFPFFASALLVIASSTLSARADMAAQPSDFTWIGCVPSGSECRSSCASRQVMTRTDDEQCDATNFATQISCYCKDEPAPADPVVPDRN